MKEKIKITLKLTLCDRNRNFDEIIESIYQVIKERDGVDDLFFEVEKENKKEIKW